MAQLLIAGEEIHNASNRGAEQDPEELIPVEVRDAEPIRRQRVIERWPQRGDERDQQQEIKPIYGFSAARRLVVHEVAPFVERREDTFPKRVFVAIDLVEVHEIAGSRILAFSY